MRNKTARYALLTALAMVLSWLESLLVFPGLLPGMKVGLTNIVVLFALYRMGLRDAVWISLARVLLASMTFGNAYSFSYSLAGAALSLAVMAGLKKWDKFSLLGVSAAGGVCHNLGQLAVAAAVLETARLGWYLPALLASGTAAGVVIGIAGGLAVERVRL
ncbi:MAG: Gx transporter family protein [Oscillospiraceae bacterium]|jgi:heptaprenyl diphosphate synthase|nr:Gx transporter family protein [Oscillospiraceae bacterium]